MKVVIDISEEDYKTILNSKLPYVGEPPMSLVWMIRYGQVLPKGHGDLIDRSVLQEQIHNSRYSDDFCAEHNIDRSINLNVAEMSIANALAVIEADKENKND